MSENFIVSVQKLFEEINTPNLVILDCRGTMKGPETGQLLFAESHIPGARKIEFSTEIKGILTETTGRTPLPDRQTLQNRLQTLGIDNQSRIVIYDDGHFNLAPRVWFSLRWMGLADVAVLNGGFRAWQEAGLPVTSEIVSYERGNFKASTPLETVIDLSTIEENLSSHVYQLIDARGYPAYSGENPGPDPIGGHIPGSINRPNNENVRADGLLVDLDDIREEFLELSEGNDSHIIHTCGSGVAACGNHLMTRAAGLHPAGVYIGSFSQWIRNPKHPISIKDE